MCGNRIIDFARTSWVDIVWVIFIILNLLAMRLLPGWQTVPFLIIWVSLTAIYGFRLWHLGSTVLAVLIVTLATGGLIGWQVIRGKQDADYLAEVPLLAIHWRCAGRTSPAPSTRRSLPWACSHADKTRECRTWAPSLTRSMVRQSRAPCELHGGLGSWLLAGLLRSSASPCSATRPSPSLSSLEL